MNEPELPPFSDEVQGLLDDAARVETADSSRKHAVWRRVSNTVGGRTAPRRRWRAVGAVVAAAAAVLVWVLVSGPGAGSGSLSARGRTTVTLAPRGAAVAEPGAALSWDMDRGGEVAVEQTAGRVFYRVEPGAPFVVSTAVAQVSVTGTAFEVEIEPMDRKTLKSMSVGAAVAAAVVVTVYEGRVVVANDHGKAQVVAGQSVRAQAGAAPGEPTERAPLAGAPDDGAIGNAVGGGVRQDQLVRELRRRVDDLEGQLEQRQTAGSDDEGEEGDDDQAFMEGFFAPTSEQLVAEAEGCRIKYAAPSGNAHGDPTPIDAATIDRIGLSPDEVDAVHRVFADLNTAHVARVRALYIAATADEAGATTLSLDAMEDEIVQKAGPDADREARRQVSHERAGLTDLPTDPLADEPLVQLYRTRVARTADLVRRLDQALGPDRARTIRPQLPMSLSSLGGCTP